MNPVDRRLSALAPPGPSPYQAALLTEAKEAASGDMGGGNARKSKQEQKRVRLAASLRENLKRRKIQQRSRAAEPAPVEPDENERPSSEADGEPRPRV